MPEIPPPALIKALQDYNLLPAIIFVPSRRKCDEYASEVAYGKSFASNKQKKEARVKIYEEFVFENPEVKRHKHKRILLQSGVASHHAGHIPAWKFLIEKMMSEGLVNALFATSTVAAGVDFPARTVVISNADTRGNDGFRPLEASELQQMTGRAGRRGKDKVGFVVLAPSNFQNPPRIAKLLNAPPDPLDSKFRATYLSLLNLLDAFGNFEQVREIAERSFAFRDIAKQIAIIEKRKWQTLNNLNNKLKTTELGITLDDLIAFERLVSARNRLDEKLSVSRADLRLRWLKENVKTGQIVSKSRSGTKYLFILSIFGNTVAVMRENGRGTNIDLSHIKRVFSKQYKIDELSIEKAFHDIYERANPVIKEPKLSNQRENTEAPATLITNLIDQLLPQNLFEEQIKLAHQLFWETLEDTEFVNRSSLDIENLKSTIWQPFEKRARVLNHFGYLDFKTQKVSDEGKWLADLRIDRPLHVGEALKQGIFDKLQPKEMAGLMAALVGDSERNYGELYISDRLIEILGKIEKIVIKVSNTEWDYGVEPAYEINHSASGLAENWVNGAEWSHLVREADAEEGDIFRLLSRTGEALLQIAHLKDSNPEAVKIARETSEIILREPIR